MEMRKISRRGSRSSDYAEHGYFTSLFCRGQQRNMQKFITFFLSLNRPFILFSRCRRRRSFLAWYRLRRSKKTMLHPFLHRVFIDTICPLYSLGSCVDVVYPWGMAFQWLIGQNHQGNG